MDRDLYIDHSAGNSPGRRTTTSPCSTEVDNLQIEHITRKPCTDNGIICCGHSGSNEHYSHSLVDRLNGSSGVESGLLGSYSCLTLLPRKRRRGRCSRQTDPPEILESRVDFSSVEEESGAENTGLWLRLQPYASGSSASSSSSSLDYLEEEMLWKHPGKNLVKNADVAFGRGEGGVCQRLLCDDDDSAAAQKKRRCVASGGYVTWSLPGVRRQFLVLLTAMVCMVAGVAAVGEGEFSDASEDKAYVPQITQQPVSQTLNFHTPTSLTCGFRPRSAQVRWLFNGRPLDTREHPLLEMVGSGLRFRPLRPEDGIPLVAGDRHEPPVASDGLGAVAGYRGGEESLDRGGLSFTADLYERDLERQAGLGAGDSAAVEGFRGLSAGEYRCTATTSNGTVISHPAFISLPELHPFPAGQDSSLEVPRGGYVTVTCPAPVSVPQAEISLLAPGGNVLKHGDFFHGAVVQQLPSGSYLLSGLEPAASGTYRCVAANAALGTNVTSPQAIRVSVVDNNGKPYLTRLLPGASREVRALMGTTVVLECPSLGHAPPGSAVGSPRSRSGVTPALVWIKKKGSLPAGRCSTDPFGNLVIENMDGIDEGVYQCMGNVLPDSDTDFHSDIPYGGGTQVDDLMSMTTTAPYQEVVLIPQSAPVATIVRKPEGFVTVGASVELECFVGAYPTPHVTWYHNGEEIQEADNLKVLALHDVEESDAGVYQCMATSGIGSAHGVARLEVKEMPVLREESQDPDQEAKDLESRLERERQKERDKAARRKGRKRQGKRRDMRTRKKNDKRKYQPSEPPEVEQLSDRSVKLTWKVEDRGDGREIRFFKIQYREKPWTENEWITRDDNVKPNVRSFDLSPLNPHGSYKFRIGVVYKSDETSHSPSTDTFPMQPQHHARASAPNTPPTIVEVQPIVFDNNYGLGIKWHYKPESLIPIEGFIILYKPFGSDIEDQIVDLPEPSIHRHVLRDLHPSTDYTIRMKSYNKVGTSQPSNKVNGKTRPRENSPGLEQLPVHPPPQEAPDADQSDDDSSTRQHRSSNDLEQTVILCIAIGVLVVVLVPLVTMCLCKYLRQKRRSLASNSDLKFQEQAQCFLSTGADHSNLKQPHQPLPQQQAPAQSQQPNHQPGVNNGGLYPSAGGGGGGGLPGGSSQGQGHSHMNLGINPLSEYDLQTSVHGSVANSAAASSNDRSKQYFSNGGISTLNSRYGEPPPPHHPHHMCNNNSCQHPHLACHGDMAYMEQQQQQHHQAMHGMQQRSLPTAPTPHSFYSEAGSISRLPSHSSSTVNHDYSEPGDHHHHHHHEMMSHPQQHRPGMVPMSNSASGGGLSLHHHHVQQQQQKQQQHPPQPPPSLPPQQPPPHPPHMQHQQQFYNQMQHFNHNNQMMSNEACAGVTFSNPNAIMNTAGGLSVNGPTSKNTPGNDLRSGSVGSIGASRTYDQAWGGPPCEYPHRGGGTSGAGGTLGRNNMGAGVHPHPHLHSERLTPPLHTPSTVSASSSSNSSSSYSPSKTGPDFHASCYGGGPTGGPHPLPSSMHPHGVMSSQFAPSSYHPNSGAATGPVPGVAPSSSLEFGPGGAARQDAAQGRGGRHHKRRKKRMQGRHGNNQAGRLTDGQREMAVKDQATNTDLSSNEGTFEFRTFAQGVRATASSVGGSSASESEEEGQGQLSGSEVEEQVDPSASQGLYHYCDSSFANHGSMESLEGQELTSAPVSSGEDDGVDEDEEEDEEMMMMRDKGHPQFHGGSHQHHHNHDDPHNQHHHHHHHHLHHLHHQQQQQQQHRQQQTSPTSASSPTPAYQPIFSTQSSHVPVPL